MTTRPVDVRPLVQPYPNPKQLARSYDPVIVLWAQEFERILSHPPLEAYEYLKSEWKRVAYAAGWGWSNTHWRFNTGIAHLECLFLFLAPPDYGVNENGELTVWDRDGNWLMGPVALPDSSDERVEIAREAIRLGRETYRNFRCSRCKEMKPKAERAGNYFAGAYCDICWTKPYEVKEFNSPHPERDGRLGKTPKEIEAAETYN